MKSQAIFKKTSSYPIYQTFKIPKTWDAVELKDVIKYKRGISYKGNEINEDGKGDYFITLNSFQRGGGFDHNGIAYFSGISDKEIKSGDILVAITDITRAAHVIGHSMIVPKLNTTKKIFNSMDTIKIQIIDKRISPEFLYHVLNDDFIHNSAIACSAGTTVLHLDLDAFEKIKIPFPPLNIQKRILENIKKLEENIHVNQKVLKKCTELKGQLLQSIPTKGLQKKKLKTIQIVPRFLSYDIPEHWESKTLSSISSEIKDGPMGFKLHTYDYVDDSGIPIIRVKNLQNLTVMKNDLKFINQKKHEELEKSQVKPRDIIISKTGVNLGVIGIMPEDFGPANLNQALGRITLKNKNYVYFVAMFLAHSFPQKILEVLGSSRTAQPGLKMSDIKNLQIPIPPKNEIELITKKFQDLDKILENIELKIIKGRKITKMLTHSFLFGKIDV